MRYYFLLIVLFIKASCTGQEKEQETVYLEQQSAQSAYQKVSEMAVDSARVEAYIDQQKLDSRTADNLREFYRNRDYQYAWFDKDGLAEQATVFWNLHNMFIGYSRDSSYMDEGLHKTMEMLLNEGEALTDPALIEKTELGLTEHFFDYAQFAYEGKVNPRDLQWHIPRKKVNAVALLDELIETKGRDLEEWKPVNKKYLQLREKLLQYYDLEKSGGYQKIDFSGTLRRGDSAAAITAIKTNLRLLGDYSSDDSTPYYDDTLENAVLRFQERHGLAADGVIGPGTMGKMNLPLKERIEKMLINMERMRWMPQEPEGNRLQVNIPEFKLHVYENGAKKFDMNVVVGRAANRTVVFNDELKHIVFSPYWNIPQSIVRNEIYPAMQRDPNYLAKNNMERRGTSNGLPVIRQKPGPGNALGKVKFLFPNSYAIYFHDTPAKSLFSRDQRAFSHGCIRLEEPKKLAEYLLRNKSGWTSSRIDRAMNAGSEQWVNLSEPVPVVITYFTAWTDADGTLHFRDDIYGHDKRMAAKLFD